MTHGKLTLAFLFLMAAMLSGCQASNFKFNPAASLGSPPVAADGVPDCVVNVAELYIDGNVLGWNAVSDVGVNLGYNPGGTAGTVNNVGGTANVNVQTFAMDMIMWGKDPFNTQVALASGEPSQQDSAVNLGLNVDFSQYAGGLTWASDPNLSKVSQQVISKGLDNMRWYLSPRSWVGRVIRILDGQTVMMNAGRKANMSVGDTFNVYNVDHQWADNTKPCLSTHLTTTNRRLVGTITVTDVSDDHFGLGAFTQTGSEAVKRGAEVWVVHTTNTLARLVSLGQIGGKITLPGNVAADLTQSMTTQLKTTVLNATDLVEIVPLN